MATYDAEIIKWHNDLPSILSDTNEQCPEFLRRVRSVMKWRFQNLRIILHRPVLLNTALRCSSFSELSSEEKIAVRKCRLVAAKTIEDMSNECLPDLISGWNAVWFAFQACMVPLVSLFSDTSMPEEAEKWRASIETALAFFERSKPWSIAAKRSMDAVAKLYQAYKVQLATQQPLPPPPALLPIQHHQPQYNHHMVAMGGYSYDHVPDVSPLTMHPGMVGQWGGDPQVMGQLSGFWDDMMWDTNLPDILETPFGLASDYDFQGAAQDSGAPCWMQGN
jgi:hypothetical protein